MMSKARQRENTRGVQFTRLTKFNIHDTKFRFFFCGKSDLYYSIVKSQNIITRIVAFIHVNLVNVPISKSFINIATEAATEDVL